MNRRLLLVLFLLLSFIGICLGKVLVVVEYGYYYDPETVDPSDGLNRVDRYISDVIEKDGKQAERVVYTNVGGATYDNCYALMDGLLAEYTPDVEGVVLIGDLPVPMFYYDAKAPDYPCDYFYMDFWDDNTNAKYPDIRVVWPVIDHPDPNVSGKIFYYEEYQGDDNPDVWASRINAKKLGTVRNSGMPWGSFLEQYEILNNHLDRLHKRMTSNASVPQRALIMGHPYNNFTQTQMLDWLKMMFKNMPVDDQQFIADPDDVMERWRGSNPAHWQALLQAGPYGNINYGAAKGERFSVQSSLIRTHDEYLGDTRGYEWACIHEHSAANAHGFRDSHNGGFASTNQTKLWTRVLSGGYSGNGCDAVYFTCYERDNVKHQFVDGQSGYTILNESKYEQELPVGKYEVYYYVPDGIANTGEVYFNAFINENEGYFVTTDGNKQHVGGYITLQEDIGQKWVKLLPLNNVTEINITVADAKLKVSFTAFLERYTDDGNKVVYADAVKYVKIDPLPIQEFYIDNANDLDISIHRSFSSMRDDGDSSKSQFFLMNACQINNFNFLNNLGNSYALADNGLLAFATSTYGGGGDFYHNLLMKLKEGKNFGEAALHFIKWEDKFPGPRCFVLLGAGTLTSDPYYPYIDYVDYILTGDIESKRTLWVKNNVDITDATVLSSSPYTDQTSLIVSAGNRIRITPEFHAQYGSFMHLKIDPELLSALNP